MQLTDKYGLTLKFSLVTTGIFLLSCCVNWGCGMKVKEPDRLVDTITVAPQSNIKMKRLEIPHGWSVNVPLDAIDTTMVLDNGYYGGSFSMEYHINLEFNSSMDSTDIRPCDLTSQTEHAQKRADKWSEAYPRTPQDFVIDTIDNHVGVIAMPWSAGRATLSICDCETGAQLELNQSFVLEEDKDLVMEIFHSLEFTAPK